MVFRFQGEEVDIVLRQISLNSLEQAHILDTSVKSAVISFTLSTIRDEKEGTIRYTNYD